MDSLLQSTNFYGLTVPTWLIVSLFIWSVPWKGLALWKAARISHKRWFVILLITNTFGILEIIYIYFVAKKYIVEVEEIK